MAESVILSEAKNLESMDFEAKQILRRPDESGLRITLLPTFEKTSINSITKKTTYMNSLYTKGGTRDYKTVQDQQGQKAEPIIPGVKETGKAIVL